MINLNKRYVFIEKYEKKDTKIKSYTDGHLYIGTLTHRYNEKGKKIGEAFEKICKLQFSFMSIREEDKIQAYQTDTQVDVKVRVPSGSPLKEDHTVNIYGDWFEIIRKDRGNDNDTYLFLRKRSSRDPIITEEDISPVMVDDENGGVVDGN